MQTLLHVALRQNAIFIPKDQIQSQPQPRLQDDAAILAANLARLGFGLDQSLLNTLNQTLPSYLHIILATLREVMGVNKNWTPLVKGWDTPTGESHIDHVLTLFANTFDKLSGTRLACGHLVPDNTFPLHRYTGCPFCGTPFQTNTLELKNQASKLRPLHLWTEKDASLFLSNLLESKTALDATQVDSLKILLAYLPIPHTNVEMKETLMLVVNTFIDLNQADKASPLFKNPADILRFLWYRHTGYLQIIEPKTIIHRSAANSRHIRKSQDLSTAARDAAKQKLKLKYSRPFAKMVAQWLNNLTLPADKAAEIMHPKRSMWVRFIRALRLNEYAKLDGFQALAQLLHSFQKQTYEVWQGRLDKARLQRDADTTFAMLRQRPGLFARALFASMLHFGPKPTQDAFSQIIDKVPARLLFTLNAFAPNYFNPQMPRSVKPLGGNNKTIPPHRLLKNFDRAQLQTMQDTVGDICIAAMQKRFANQPNTNKTIFIDPLLDMMPVSIGDRSSNVQDLPSALMGTRFPILGNTIRLFMQWGEGLPAQHLDMDLSARVIFDQRLEMCYFGNLTTKGCKHSGDIRAVPDKVGTAEYIDIDLPTLRKAEARFVVFASNAYSSGSLSPNMVVGWMDSKYPMSISQTTGVAYDPSCVQHQIRITQALAKGLIFGILDVPANEIVWLEMSFGGQVAHQMDLVGIHALLHKLKDKLNIGALLRLKAQAQNLQPVDTAEQADEAYTTTWAQDIAAVTKLLID